MLRKFLDYQLSLAEEGKPLHRLHPLFEAIDTFLYEAPNKTTGAPHIRDGVDLKRIMMLVVIALTPCILMAIWNTGLQKMVYASGDAALFQAYEVASTSFKNYFAFGAQHFGTIVWLGIGAFVPIMLISYMAGGLWEAVFACVRRHPISEGFLVTGMLYALIIPATTPYWVVAIGVSVGVILSKELFGGTGYNILNPALVCRCFLYFTFPTKLSGLVWAGTNPTVVQKSILKINETLGTDGISQATALGILNTPSDVKRIHIDAIINNKWPEAFATLKDYLTQGLGLSLESYDQALQFAKLKMGEGLFSDGNLFFGNMLGSMGETSTLACILGAILLLITGIGSWRSMLAYAIGVFATAYIFQIGSHFGPDNGMHNLANFDFPAYKQFLIGGLAFGLVFMATDPVSSPDMPLSKWIYGLLIGLITVVIRIVNPAFPEGVMLAILFGNVLAPLLDTYALKRYRRVRRVT